MKPKFEIGDTVRIKGSDWFSKLPKLETGGWTLSECDSDFFIDTEMTAYAGVVTEISEVIDDSGDGSRLSYHVMADGEYWFWPEEALLPVEVVEKEESPKPEVVEEEKETEADKIWVALTGKQRQEILDIKEVQEYLQRPKVGDKVFTTNAESLLRNRADMTYGTVQGYDFLYGKVVTDKGCFTHYIHAEDLDNPAAQIFKVPQK